MYCKRFCASILWFFIFLGHLAAQQNGLYDREPFETKRSDLMFGFSKANFDSTHSFDVLHYRLDLTFPLISSAFSGTESYDFPIYDPYILFHGGIIYKKGGLVFHMLRHVVGDEDFQDILKTYYHMYRYSNASIPEFQDFKIAIETNSVNITKHTR